MMALFKLFNFILAVAVAAIAYIAYLPYPPTPSLEQLSTAQQQWHSNGQLTSVNGFKMFYRLERRKDAPVVILIHGFPSSSFDYHKIFDSMVNRYHNILVFDHVGFGFSEKPASGFSYSCVEHADQMLTLLRQLDIRVAHWIAHDMGDSILTEILTRRRLELLPAYFDGAFKSVTFTNGGMLVRNIGFRLSQRLLLLPYVGKWLSHAFVKLQINKFSHQQLGSLWGNCTECVAGRKADIEDLLRLNAFRGGALNMHSSIHYLRDRFVFETRWMKSVAELDVPCRFVWGDSDAVSPKKMARDLQALAPQCRMKLLKEVGHFLMLERPGTWMSALELP